MKYMPTLLSLLGLATSSPQIPTPPSQPPDIPPSSPPQDPPPSTILTPPVPTETGSPGQGPICQCGYTYCASVLQAMKVPWSDQRLAEAYCSTPNAACGGGGVPPTNITSGLFICLCDNEDDELGTDLDLLCGCDTCLNIGPDYRGRCKTPCTSSGCHSKSEDGGS